MNILKQVNNKKYELKKNMRVFTTNNKVYIFEKKIEDTLEDTYACFSYKTLSSCDFKPIAILPDIFLKENEIDWKQTYEKN